MRFPNFGNRSTTLGRTPALVHLSGVRRGKAVRLNGRTWHLLRRTSGAAVLSDEPGGMGKAEVLARFHPSGQGFELEIHRGSGVRLNGALAFGAQLNPGDLVSLEGEPLLLRYSLLPKEGGDRVDTATLLEDCLSRTRYEARGKLGFLARLPVNFALDVSSRGSLWFRTAVVAGFVFLVVVNIMQWNRNIELRRQFETESTWFRAQQSEFMSRNELEMFQENLKQGLADTRRRVTDLETRPETLGQIISDASRAIVFLQGAWVYQEQETGRKMRYLVTEEGRPLVTRSGQALTSLEGNGPVAIKHFTGTAFVIDAEGTLMTNRHVVHPWEDDDALEALAETGVVPVLEQFIGYLPGIPKPFPVITGSVSSGADLALLSCSGITGEIPHIKLASTLPKPGEEVFVLGYPTGLRALVARTNEAFVQNIREQELDFWQIAGALAEKNLIHPLASRGIVGQVTSDVIAYDAETTRGGSGGPVLNSNGELVAVNNAILPEYGGSNLGVPINHVMSLLEKPN